MQKRRVVPAMINYELAVALLNVEFPDFLPIKIEAGDVAGAHGAPDMFAVGAGGRRGVVAFAFLNGGSSLVANQFFPKMLAVGV